MSTRRLFHTGAGIAVLLALLLLSGACGSHRQTAEILWDRHGVPHVSGRTAAEMYYGFGWAQMESHAGLILRLYAQARGEASRHWGETWLESDKKIRMFGIPQRAREATERQEAPYSSYTEAFVHGMNDYAAAHPEAIGDTARLVLPLHAADVNAHVLRVLFLEFLAGEELYHIRREAGSNAIAIAPSRSASGKALLLANPHLPWSDFFLWYEAHLTSGDFDAYGITLVGMPTLAMAFNRHLGWAFTVNTIDAADRYRIEVKDGTYLLDGRWEPLETVEDRISVRQADGSIREETVSYRYSAHGPVVGSRDGQAWALRIAGMDRHRILEQFHRMAAAPGLDGFEEALALQQNPMFNILYADRAGNILYLFNGSIPVRPEGDFAAWRNAVDGSQSRLIWQELHPYADLPRVLNPPSGFLQNCNDPPWFCTLPAALDPADYPAYLAPRFLHLRAQRALRWVRDAGQISTGDLMRFKFDTGMEAADRVLDDLLAAAERHPEAGAAEAAEVLRTWDRRTEAGSRGALLFARWYDLGGAGLFETAWNPDDPVHTPLGLRDTRQAAGLLAKAAAEIKEQYGALDTPWGDVHRFRAGDTNLPANGGPEHYGIFRAIGYSNPERPPRIANGGDSYIAVIEFGSESSAMVTLSYPNATRGEFAGSGSAATDASEKRLRPALLNRREILQHLHKREELNYDEKASARP
jgi:acyl-homoserine-lactone acylase